MKSQMAEPQMGEAQMAEQQMAEPQIAGSLPPRLSEPLTEPGSPIGVLDLEEDNDLDRPWIVLVWNDPINLMDYVTLVLQKVFGYSKEKATSLMLDVHHKGKAVVSSGTRSSAERDVFRLQEHGLWATLQQDD